MSQSEAASPPPTRRRYLLLLGLALVTAYVLPLYLPPESAPALPPPEASLLERVFPGVPNWWVAGRLGCLLVGSLLLVVGTGDAHVPRSGSPLTPQQPRALLRATTRRLVFGFSALQVAASFWAASFPRWLQLAYLAALAVPPAAIWYSSCPRVPARGVATRPSRWAITTVAVIIVWMVLRLPGAWSETRIADMPDTTIELEVLERSTPPSFNVLTDSFFPGVTGVHRVLEGVGWVHVLAMPVPFWWLQAAQVFWLLVSAAVLAWVTAINVGRAAAPVATAAFLFSPLASCVPLLGVPLPLGSAYALMLLALVLLIHYRHSLTALAAFGGVTGLAASHPGTAPTAGLMWIAALWSIRQARREFPWEICGSAMLSCAAVLLPGLHNLRDLQNLGMASGQWAAIEAGLFGQLRPSLVELSTMLGNPLPFDNPMGALLAPFAIPRTAVRLWGDTLFEPLATILATVGLLSLLYAVWRSPRALWLPALLAATLLPGFVSSYDRPSLIRFLALSVPMALLTAVGFERLRHALRLRNNGWFASTVAAAVIAVSGTTLFDFVNPSILPRSAFAIALESIQGQRPCPRAVLLRPWIWRAWRLEIPTQEVPACPLRIVDYESAATLQREHEAAPDIVFWVPGQEEEDRISEVACRLWPRAVLHTLVDRVNASKVYGFSWEDSKWEPSLPADRHTISVCGATLETDATTAQAAMNRAEHLLIEGRRAEAIGVLRGATRSVFLQPQLYDKLARLLLEGSPPTTADIEQAIYWARRASLVAQERDPRLLRTLAQAYTAAGRVEEARKTIDRAGRVTPAHTERSVAGTPGFEAAPEKAQPSQNDREPSAHGR